MQAGAAFVVHGRSGQRDGSDLGSDRATTAPVHATPYRGDIDGLRAISVIAVIIYHLFPTRFPAGGLGVDIFFVISGYLIGGIVLASVAARRFTFGDFYLRRLRRIAPAFVVMIIATTLVSTIPLYPQELASFATSALAALACVGNIFFYFTSDYFAADSATLPLLHTWSLGVEEQFYLVFPFLPLLIAHSRWKRWLVPIMTVTALLSLAVSIAYVRTNAAAAFYLLPSRWWELMVGVLASQMRGGWLTSRPLTRLASAAAGLGLIAASLLLVRPEHGFPGLVVVPACLGAALVLMTGQGTSTMVHRALSVFPARYIGLASYSLYLWHWPVIVLYRQHRLIGKLLIRDAVIVLIVTAILGFASWKFIEGPFRGKMAPRRLGAWCGGLIAIAALLQVGILATGGLPERFSPTVLAIASAGGQSGSMPKPKANCFLTNQSSVGDFDKIPCLAREQGKPNWLLVGDSHASMMWRGLSVVLPQVHFQTAVVFGCEMPLDPQPTGRVCDDLMHQVLVRDLDIARPDAVLVIWRWIRLDIPALKRLHDRLASKGIALVVMGPTPEYSMPVPRIMAESVRRSDPGLLARTIEPRLWKNDRELAAQAKAIGFTYLSPLKAMCPKRRCIVESADDGLLYFDAGHYNQVGSQTAVRRLIANDASQGWPLRQALADTSAKTY